MSGELQRAVSARLAGCLVPRAVAYFYESTYDCILFLVFAQFFLFLHACFPLLFFPAFGHLAHLRVYK